MTGRIRGEHVLRAAARHFGLSRATLLRRQRTRDLVYPRHVAMYAARVETGLSFAQIGNLFGGFDHTNILHGVRCIAQAIERQDPRVLLDVSIVRAAALAMAEGRRQQRDTPEHAVAA